MFSKEGVQFKTNEELYTLHKFTSLIMVATASDAINTILCNTIMIIFERKANKIISVGALFQCKCKKALLYRQTLNSEMLFNAKLYVC